MKSFFEEYQLGSQCHFSNSEKDRTFQNDKESHHGNSKTKTSKQRVDQKLSYNRLRRQEIELYRQQQKENILRKKKQKLGIVEEVLKKRIEEANRAKEDILMGNTGKQFFQRKLNQAVVVQRNSSAKILQGRMKADERRNEYVIKIHKKLDDRFRKVKEKKHIYESMEIEKSSSFHLNEWRCYEKVLKDKYKDQQLSSPSQLYKKHKEKADVAYQMMKNLEEKKEHSNQNKQITDANQKDEKIEKEKEKDWQLKKTHKPQYFGIFHENQLNKTRLQVEKMRKFLINQRTQIDPLQDDELLTKFEAYILQ